MKVKGKYSESFPMYMAFLAAGAAAAIAGFFIIYNSLGGASLPVADKKPQTSQEAPATTPNDSLAYVPEEAESEEMKDAAIELIGNNYEVLKLFYLKGMNHEDEPYGNIPEDNYYTVSSKKYTSLSQLEELVSSTYTASVAKDVMSDPLGYGAIYATRDNGDLGIIYGFTPMDYDISWENPNFRLEAQSAEECSLTVTVTKKETSEETELSGTMVKTDDGWRLDSVIY